VSGVGISFGADRIYDVLNQLDLFNDIKVSSTDILVVNFGGETEKYALTILDLLRGKDISAELYPDAVKLKKQLSYADSKKISHIIMAGDDEIKNKSITIKNMTTGNQKSVLLTELEMLILNEFKNS